MSLAERARVDRIRTFDVPSCSMCGQPGVVLHDELRDRLFHAPGVWRLRQCSNADCELVWLDPQPHVADIPKLYGEYFTHSAPSAPVSRNYRRQIRLGILADRFGYALPGGTKAKLRLGKLCSLVGPWREMVGGLVYWVHAHPGGKLLDVGCGSGEYLVRMRDLGWEVHGIEPDAEAARVATEQFALDVRCRTVADARFGESSFDAITMNNVIEHVPDPVAALKQVASLLKPGAPLVIITPNIGSLGRRIFGEAWVHWDPPRHFYLFSRRTLPRCAIAAGLAVRSLFTTSRSARGAAMASRLILRRGHAPGVTLATAPTSFWDNAFQLIEHMVNRFASSAGEELVLIATRK